MSTQYPGAGNGDDAQQPRQDDPFVPAADSGEEDFNRSPLAGPGELDPSNDPTDEIDLQPTEELPPVGRGFGGQDHPTAPLPTGIPAQNPAGPFGGSAQQPAGAHPSGAPASQSSAQQPYGQPTANHGDPYGQPGSQPTADDGQNHYGPGTTAIMPTIGATGAGAAGAARGAAQGSSGPATQGQYGQQSGGYGLPAQNGQYAQPAQNGQYGPYGPYGQAGQQPPPGAHPFAAQGPGHPQAGGQQPPATPPPGRTGRVPRWAYFAIPLALLLLIGLVWGAVALTNRDEKEPTTAPTTQTTAPSRAPESARPSGTAKPTSSGTAKPTSSGTVKPTSSGTPRPTSSGTAKPSPSVPPSAKPTTAAPAGKLKPATAKKVAEVTAPATFGGLSQQTFTKTPDGGWIAPYQNPTTPTPMTTALEGTPGTTDLSGHVGNTIVKETYRCGYMKETLVLCSAPAADGFLMAKIPIDGSVDDAKAAQLRDKLAVDFEAWLKTIG